MKALVLLLFFVNTINAVRIDLENLKVVQTNIGPKYVGVTLDSSIVQRHWENFDFKSKKILNLAKGLAPNYIRLGGTECDYLVFNMTGDDGSKKNLTQHTNFTMSVEDWDKINQFVEEVGWDLIFDFNVFLRKDGKWDPSNAIELLKYTIQRGYKPAGYELGNELDVFKEYNVTAEEVAPDFATLKGILSSSPQLAPFFILGTDAGTMGSRSTTFMELFFKAGGGNSIDVATFHHYYMNSLKATVESFHSVSTLDSLRPLILACVDLCKKYIPTKQIWIGETSSSYGGGAENISDRYVASYLWLDKLGLSTKLGIQGLLRQTFYGGNYGLINSQLNPNPDYWLTYLFKKLVGSPVFNVESPDPDLRIYSHCTNTNSSMGYQAGLTVYMMNLSNRTIPVDFTADGGQFLHLFIFSPGDDNGLTSKLIKLNGKVLELTSEDEIPPMNVVISRSKAVNLEAYNMGYVVIPGARNDVCH